MYNNSLANCQNLCPKCAHIQRHTGLDATQLDDSGINDRMIRRHTLIN